MPTVDMRHKHGHCSASTAYSQILKGPDLLLTARKTCQETQTRALLCKHCIFPNSERRHKHGHCSASTAYSQILKLNIPTNSSIAYFHYFHCIFPLLHKFPLNISIIPKFRNWIFPRPNISNISTNSLHAYIRMPRNSCDPTERVVL
jgi:hypothetical protein